jgi:hypothetical protein
MLIDAGHGTEALVCRWLNWMALGRGEVVGSGSALWLDEAKISLAWTSK